MSMFQDVRQVWRDARTVGGILAGQLASARQSTKAPEGFVKIIPPGASSTPVLGTFELLDGYSRFPFLRAVVDKISQGVGETIWTLMVRDQFIQESPLLNLLQNPNPEMSGDEFFRLAGKYMCLVNEVFWLIERNGVGMPIELWPIPAHWIRSIPAPGDENGVYEIQWNTWRANIPSRDIIYLRDPDPVNPYARASGPAKALGDELESDEFAAKHIKMFFINRARPDLLIFSADKDHPIEKDDAERLERKWLEKLSSFRNSHRPFFLPGKVGVKELSSSFSDMKMVELRKFLRDVVLQIYGLPPEALGILDASNRSTITAAEFFLTKHVQVPKIKMLRSGMARALVPQFDARLKLGFINPVEQDKEHILAVMEATPWAFDIDEIRALADHEPDPVNGPLHATPFNLLFQEQLSSSVDVSQDRAVSRGTKEVDVIDIEGIVQVIGSDEFGPELEQANTQAVEAFGQNVIDEVDVGIDFNIQSPRVVDFLREQSVDRVVGLTNETTKKLLRNALADGIAEGEGAAQLSKRITAVFSDARGQRSFKIARTESVRATNFGALSGMQQVGIPEKQWLTVGDSLVRKPEHTSLHLQIRDVNNAFTTSTGNQSQYPGGFGIAELDIECRCSILSVIPKEEEALTDFRAKTFESRRLPFQRLIQRAYINGFREQQKLVLEALEEADE